MADELKKLSSAGLEARLDAAWDAGDDELAAAVSAELARRSEYGLAGRRGRARGVLRRLRRRAPHFF